MTGNTSGEEVNNYACWCFTYIHSCGDGSDECDISGDDEGGDRDA